jgi:hypothetical protein
VKRRTSVPQSIQFKRADPFALALFDPATKICTMNCGRHMDDPRSREECKFLCEDCLPMFKEEK